MSEVEKLILSKDFSYLHPLFYNHPLALRCELETALKPSKLSVKHSYENALKIFDILFPNGADALFFDYYIFDYSVANEEEKRDETQIKSTVEHFESDIRFLSYYQNKYRHKVIKGLEKCENFYEYLLSRNRVVCYADEIGFEYKKLIKMLVSVDISYTKHKEVHFVSFQNECILSIYDDMGCDIVFTTKEKYREFFDKLKAYLFDYDLEEMKKRYI